jgi:hypothetical protein
MASIRCQPSDLRLAVGSPVSEKTQQDSALLTLTNIGTLPCHLFGYPGISRYDAQGALLPLSYRWQGDQMVTSAPPQPVILRADATGYVLVNKNECTLSQVALPTTLRLFPPDDDTSLVLDDAPSLAMCGPGDEGDNTLDISPVEATVSAALSTDSPIG